jgi:hypothetical protein
MLKKYLIPALTTGALMVTLVACDSSPTPPVTDGSPTTEAPQTNGAAETVGDRADYTEVPVPAGAVGATPTEVALSAFGSTEPGEGNFTEDVVVVEETANQALVVLTQTGLADDSVNGMRYRLEFVPEGDQWRLDWAGRQVRCQSGRGSQDWTTELCS